MASESVFEQIERDSDDLESITWKDRIRRSFVFWVVVPFKTIWMDWRARFGLVIIVFYILLGTVGPLLVDTPVQNEGPTYVPALTDWQFPLGTTNWGYDILEQAVHGTPAMLQMAIAGGVFMTIVAVIVGTLAGYKRGRVERVLITVTDIQISIPGLPLLIVLAMAIQPEHPIVVGILLSIDGWPNLARALHSQVLSIREESYVEASRTIGLGSVPIIYDDILPNVMPYVLIHFMQNTIAIIHTSVALYFLGVLPFSTTNWGVMLNRAYYNISLTTLDGYYWLIIPIILISGLSFGVILFAQGIDRVFNPQVRAHIVGDKKEE